MYLGTTLRASSSTSRYERAVAAPGSEVFVSAASIWEIAIKLAIGKLRWQADVSLDASIGLAGFEELAVTAAHAAAVRDLARHHGDAFERLLAAQALGEGVAVVTADPPFESYGVRVLAAG
jgi:PIN domain nuclease of toxin-antitoxin system